MRFLRRLVDKQRALYRRPGSRLHRAWPLFDAFETFLFTPDHRTGPGGVQVRDYADLKRVMSTVIVALLPCLLWAIYNTGAQHFAAFAQVFAQKGAVYTPGWLQAIVHGDGFAAAVADRQFVPGFGAKVVFGLQRMLPILVTSYGVGLGIEMMFAVIRRHEVSEGFLVSGMLIALIVPASIPLWQLALGVAFAVVLGKEVFGGTGMNVFNPAMLCRAFLFFAFPAQMSGDFVWVAGSQPPPGQPAHVIDGYSCATPLAVVKDRAVHEASAVLQAFHDHAYSWADMFFGNIPGSAGETSKLCVLLGAFWLVFTGVGSWRVMVAGVLGLLGTSFALRAVLPADFGGLLGLQPWEHLLCGGFLFGIVFMATDPVSSPETQRGKWIYGVLIGFVTMLVRTINPAYPEGTMLSILLLNAFAPGIDHFVVAANIKRRGARR